jgi:hypothetical protein
LEESWKSYTRLTKSSKISKERFVCSYLTRR